MPAILSVYQTVTRQASLVDMCYQFSPLDGSETSGYRRHGAAPKKRDKSLQIHS